MPGWQKALAPLVHSVETYYDALKYKLYDILGDAGMTFCEICVV
jgi:hypothetical protein